MSSVLALGLQNGVNEGRGEKHPSFRLKTPGVKPDFHLLICLSPTKLSSAKIKEETNKSNPKFLQLFSEIVVSGGHLPKQLSVERYWGATNDV